MSEPAETAPPGTPKEPAKRSRLLFWLGCTGCLFGLLLIGIGGTMAYLFYQESRAREENRLPDGWRDSLRIAYRLPDAVGRLVPADGPPGPDPATAPPLPADTLRRGRINFALRITRGLPLLPGDDAVMVAAMRDTALERYVATARLGSYDVLPRLNASWTSVAKDPRNGGIVHTARVVYDGAVGLVVRGEGQLRSNRVAAARGDFLSALALGALMWRNEPTAFDQREGRKLVDAGAAGLARLAERTRDSVLAADTREIRTWLQRSQRMWFFIGDDADTLLSVAADTLLPRGMRIEALVTVTQVSMYKFSRIFLGPQGSAVRGVRLLEQDRDPVVARAATLADSALADLREMGVRARWRLVTRGTRR